MPKTIGIRRETKNRWERRVPLPPAEVAALTAHGLTVLVQPSALRVFPDPDYAAAGALVQDDLTAADAIFAVKEIPIEDLLAGKTYVFFSHTIKGQAHNMPLLQRLMDLGCTLIDYERISDDQGQRLIFFGRHAGYAGMIDSLHALGRRLALEGLTTPLAEVGMAHTYADLASAKAHLRQIGEQIAAAGLPEAMGPLVVGFVGTGNVSQGAQEVFDGLPVETLTPEQLRAADLASLSRHRVYKVVFDQSHIAEPREAGRTFELSDYYARPETYRTCFTGYLPKLTVVMNCLYWEPRFPRLISRAELQALWQRESQPRLRVIGDLGCDIEGTVEVTVKATDPEQPTFVYEPATDRIIDGFAGQGPVVLAVDNLPCELPAESSQSFGAALRPFAAAIAALDTAQPLAGQLPPEVAKAVIVYRGELTPGYAYLAEHLQQAALP